MTVYEKFLKIRENEENLGRLIENNQWSESPIVKAVEQKLKDQEYEIIV